MIFIARLYLQPKDWDPFIMAFESSDANDI